MYAEKTLNWVCGSPGCRGHEYLSRQCWTVCLCMQLYCCLSGEWRKI